MSLIVVGWKLVQAYTGQHTVDYTELHWKKKDIYIYSIYVIKFIFKLSAIYRQRMRRCWAQFELIWLKNTFLYELNNIGKLIYILRVAYMKTSKTDDRLMVSHVFCSL